MTAYGTSAGRRGPRIERYPAIEIKEPGYRPPDCNYGVATTDYRGMPIRIDLDMVAGSIQMGYLWGRSKDQLIARAQRIGGPTFDPTGLTKADLVYYIRYYAPRAHKHVWKPRFPRCTMCGIPPRDVVLRNEGLDLATPYERK